MSDRTNHHETPGPEGDDEDDVDLTILGGVAGITTALAAVAEGFAVELVTRERADEGDANDTDPAFATPVGGGNVEPIGVEAVWLLRLFGASKRFYGRLREETDHVAKRPFYFVDESGDVLGNPDDAACPDDGLHLPYQGRLDDFEVCELRKFEEVEVPKREATPNCAPVARYEVFGADDSLLGALYETAEKHGVTVQKQDIDLETEALDLPGVVVNCTGFHGPLVHGTPVHEEMTPVKGHLLHVEGVPTDWLPDEAGEVDTRVEYAIVLDDGHDAVGEACGFVRDVGGDDRTLVLGGSEIEGTFVENGWKFEWDKGKDRCEGVFDGQGWRFEWSGPMTETDGRQIPERIVDVNTEVWNGLMDDDQADFDPRDYDATVVTGWRPKRDAGPRLRITECEGTTVADNYGWGSFGWTLAPGAAASLVTELQKEGVEPSGSPPDTGDPCLEAIRAALGCPGTGRV